MTNRKQNEVNISEQEERYARLGTCSPVFSELE